MRWSPRPLLIWLAGLLVGSFIAGALIDGPLTTLDHRATGPFDIAAPPGRGDLLHGGELLAALARAEARSGLTLGGARLRIRYLDREPPDDQVYGRYRRAVTLPHPTFWSPLILLDTAVAPRERERTAVHELTHALIEARYGQVPRALNEGYAYWVSDGMVDAYQGPALARACDHVSRADLEHFGSALDYRVASLPFGLAEARGEHPLAVFDSFTRSPHDVRSYITHLRALCAAAP